jgi:hypothetical protein
VRFVQYRDKKVVGVFVRFSLCAASAGGLFRKPHRIMEWTVLSNCRQAQDTLPDLWCRFTPTGVLGGLGQLRLYAAGTGHRQVQVRPADGSTFGELIVSLVLMGHSSSVAILESTTRTVED